MSKEHIPAYLYLEDGSVFKGWSMGKAGVSIGEIVFNTSMASYEGLLCDPTYYGQIVAQTYPLVGNRGVKQGAQSQIMAKGYICREWCDSPTDAWGRLTLDEYLKERGIVGLWGIDTRRLTRIIRGNGYMKAAITPSIDDKDWLMDQMKNYTIKGAVRAVTSDKVSYVKAPSPTYNMAIIDMGLEHSVLEWFLSRGVSITIYPAFTPPAEILAAKFDGIMISDGPGDPDEERELINNIKELFKSGIPLFGMGLGHQMLALAAGFSCDKMDRPHRGANQPVRDLRTGKLMITHQNHGYTVLENSVNAKAEVFLKSVNDDSVEGIKYNQIPAFSVQFAPVDGLGYQDTAWVFDEFVKMMEEGRNNA